MPQEVLANPELERAPYPHRRERPRSAPDVWLPEQKLGGCALQGQGCTGYHPAARSLDNSGTRARVPRQRTDSERLSKLRLQTRLQGRRQRRGAHRGGKRPLRAGLAAALKLAGSRPERRRWTRPAKNSGRPHPEQHRGDPPESPLKIKITLNPGCRRKSRIYRGYSHHLAHSLVNPKPSQMGLGAKSTKATKSNVRHLCHPEAPRPRSPRTA
ncbi:uncharacterized protein LOC118520071 isoform X2 [Halichoerus grypus]|uniref:uncharacterized protein LOC118520071 isoform X2 n=1 Tax=Halichoerus grypus TaxID=9711 RepID=UPI0016593799|nr:uncharacterized protein LOC118520071 isoform X2 [Halichoerus grypus]XP_035923717.1 uncharacterized protein LOC118520071 isoform X2 [Halichoerus grypus]XP_035923718.1 uncharacterized protein LOC118520071 isoform X2 [Halichoerus grypus]